MLPVSYVALVGEGCPAPDVPKCAKNRKRRGVCLTGSCSIRRERVRNLPKDWHTTDTANRKIVLVLFLQPPLNSDHSEISQPRNPKRNGGPGTADPSAGTP